MSGPTEEALLERAGPLLVGAWLSDCESPVERLLLAAFVAEGWCPCPDWVGSELFYAGNREPSRLDIAITAGTFLADARARSLLLVQPSVDSQGRNFRPDFLVVAGPDRFLSIEVDGHEFHERTKEQALRDRRRDRLFASWGWTVLRFTGSEVFRDPERCAREVRAFVSGEAGSPREATPARLARRAEATGDWCGALADLQRARRDL